MAIATSSAAIAANVVTPRRCSEPRESAMVSAAVARRLRRGRSGRRTCRRRSRTPWWRRGQRARAAPGVSWCCHLRKSTRPRRRVPMIAGRLADYSWDKATALLWSALTQWHLDLPRSRRPQGRPRLPHRLHLLRARRFHRCCAAQQPRSRPYRTIGKPPFRSWSSTWAGLMISITSTKRLRGVTTMARRRVAPWGCS